MIACEDLENKMNSAAWCCMVNNQSPDLLIRITDKATADNAEEYF